MKFAAWPAFIRRNAIGVLCLLAVALTVAYLLLPHEAVAGTLMAAGGKFLICPASPPPIVEDWQRELQAVQAAFEKRDTDLKALLEKSTAEIAATGKTTTETKTALAALVEDGKKLQVRMLDVEQKLGRRSFGNQQAVDFDKLFADHDGFKKLQAGQARSCRIDLKRHDLMHASIMSGSSVTGGSLTLPDRQPGIITPATRLPLVRDLVMPGRTTSNAIEYVKETGFTNNANVVSEGATKPQSELIFEVVSRSVRTIAHWVKASKQILDDVPQLLSYISGRLRYGLQFKEDYQLLRGDNTGQNLDGLIPNATAYNTALNKPGDKKIDVLRHAITQVRLAELRATSIVLNPQDWDSIETEKDANGRYIWANVNLGGQQQMWRLPVLDHTALDEGEFLVGAFVPAAQIFDREDAGVVVSNEDQDNFVRNMVTILVEERLVQAIYRPESFIYGDYSAISG